MLRLQRHQQRAFLYECGRNIKRLFAAYRLEEGVDSDVRLTRDYKKHAVLKNADLHNATYHKLQALISIYNKVETIDFNSPEFEFHTSIDISVASERDALKVILLQEAENALCVNGAKPRDQQLIDFLYQFNYLDWYLPRNTADNTYIEHIKQIRNALAMEDLMVILRNEGLLSKCFSLLDCLSTQFNEYIKTHNQISPLALMYIFEKDKKSDLLDPMTSHRPLSGINTSFGDMPEETPPIIVQADLNTQEMYMLAAAITFLQFKYKEMVEDSKPKDDADYDEFLQAHQPIRHGKTFYDLSVDDFNKMIGAVKAITEKYQGLPVSILEKKAEKRNNNNDADVADNEMQVRQLVQKPDVQLPQHFGKYIYPDYQRELQRNAGESITDAGVIADLVNTANASLLMNVFDVEKYRLVWDATTPLEINVEKHYDNLIRVKAANAKFNIHCQKPESVVGQIPAEVEYTFEYIPSNEDNSGSYKLIQIWTNKKAVSEIYHDKTINRIERYLVDGVDVETKRELKTIEDRIEHAKLDMQNTQEKRLIHLRDTYGQRIAYDNINISNEDCEKLITLTRDLAAQRQVQNLAENLITDIKTTFNAKFTSNKTKQILMEVLHATNMMLMHADEPASENYRHAVNRVITLQQKIRKVAVLSAVAASLTMFAAAVFITCCVLLTVFTAGAGAAIGVPALVTGAAKAGLLAVGGFGLFAGSVGKLLGVAAARKSHRHFKISNSLAKLVDNDNGNAMPPPTWRPA